MTVRLHETKAGQTLLDIRAALIHDKYTSRLRAGKREIMRLRGAKGGRVTSARRELARLAGIGIKPIKVG